MSKPELVSLDSILRNQSESMVVWTLPKLAPIVTAEFNSSIIFFPDMPDTEIETLVVIGGGILLDFAKIWRKESNKHVKLVAIPSIWGSGAENSPIAILNENGKKVIHVGDEYLPDERVVWFDLVKNLPEPLMLYACGDVWAHALEAFLSPLANNELRVESASLIKKLIELPFLPDERWFEISAHACRAQAKSSVGAVHGIAHVLEGVASEKYHEEIIGHARLCSTLLWPLWNYNLINSEKPGLVLKQYNIDKKAVGRKLLELFEKDFYKLILPLMEENWRTILRDPSTRTNCTLVRSNTLGFFKQGKFYE